MPLSDFGFILSAYCHWSLWFAQMHASEIERIWIVHASTEFHGIQTWPWGREDAMPALSGAGVSTTNPPGQWKSSVSCRRRIGGGRWWRDPLRWPDSRRRGWRQQSDQLLAVLETLPHSGLLHEARWPGHARGGRKKVRNYNGLNCWWLIWPWF